LAAVLEEEEQELVRYVSTVKMKESRKDNWIRFPTKNNVLESLASLILSGEVDDLFDVEVKEASD
jgi:hypothetical protein